MVIFDTSIIDNIIAAIFGLIIILIGLSLLVISYLLIKGKISRKQNRGIGFKITEAYASDEAWYRINREGGRLMIVPSLAVIACGLLIIYVGFVAHWLLSGVTLLTIAVFAAIGLLLTRYVRKVRQGGAKPPSAG